MNFRKFVIGCCFFALSSTAFAHPGHATGFWEAFVHPILGWDHLLAMFIVGMLAVRYSGWSALILPSLFVGALLVASASVAALHIQLGEAAEVLVLLSVVLLGVLLAFRRDLGLAALGFLVVCAGAAHGAVHGAELGMTGLAALCGLAVATCFLHVVGYVLARTSENHGIWLSRGIGFIASAVGITALITKVALN